MPDTSHDASQDPFQALAREARNTQIRYLLGDLAGYLNDRYGIDLATIQSDRSGTSQTPFLHVARGQTRDDIVVAVSVDLEGVSPFFRVAVFTCCAWTEYGDPFAHAAATDALEAGRYIWRFIPPDPPN